MVVELEMYGYVLCTFDLMDKLRTLWQKKLNGSGESSKALEPDSYTDSFLCNLQKDFAVQFQKHLMMQTCEGLGADG